METCTSLFSFLSNCPEDKVVPEQTCKLESVELRVISHRRRKQKPDFLVYLVVTEDGGDQSEVELRVAESSLKGANSSTVDSLDVGCIITGLSGSYSFLDAKKKKKYSFDRTIDCDSISSHPPIHAPTLFPNDGTDGANPTLLFDINYADQMNDLETRSLVRQLQFCYASNRRAPSPFNVTFCGANLSEDNALTKCLTKIGWAAWKNVEVVNSSSPWTEPRVTSTNIVYLTAESPNLLTEICPDTTYIIGGLVDHTDKPGVSFARASSHGLPTARLPLERAVLIRARTGPAGGAVDITTLAVVQVLLSMRQFAPDLARAIFETPAFHCAPMRKYLTWLGEYSSINDPTDGGRAKRPGEGYELVAKARSLKDVVAPAAMLEGAQEMRLNIGEEPLGGIFDGAAEAVEAEAGVEVAQSALRGLEVA
jgi:tRNA (guanine9-N1)-methyltransferase